MAYHLNVPVDPIAKRAAVQNKRSVEFTGIIAADDNDTYTFMSHRRSSFCVIARKSDVISITPQATDSHTCTVYFTSDAELEIKPLGSAKISAARLSALANRPQCGCNGHAAAQAAAAPQQNRGGQDFPSCHGECFDDYLNCWDPLDVGWGGWICYIIYEDCTERCRGGSSVGFGGFTQRPV